MTTFYDRAGNVLAHDPMLCSPSCFQTHGMPGEGRPPYTGYAHVLEETVRYAPSEWNFKHHPRFIEIAEHTNPTQAEDTLQCVKAEFADEWPQLEALLPNLIHDNDSVGQPYLARVAGYLCSPANFRYLYHACLVLGRLRHLKYGLDAVHILEIGGGYGALAYYVHVLAPIFTQRPLSYTIVDLPEACAVQRAYADYFSVELNTVDGTNTFLLNQALLPLDDKPRFLMSAYGFAEFNEDIQQTYAERLVAHCEHGLMVWNYATGWPHRPPNPIYAFTDRPMVVEPERPKSVGGYNHFVWF